MVGDNDRKMNVFFLEECIDEKKEQLKYNNENIPELKEYIKTFNEKMKKNGINILIRKKQNLIWMK